MREQQLTETVKHRQELQAIVGQVGNCRASLIIEISNDKLI